MERSSTSHSSGNQEVMKVGCLQASGKHRINRIVILSLSLSSCLMFLQQDDYMMATWSFRYVFTHADSSCSFVVMLLIYVHMCLHIFSRSFFQRQ